MPNITNNQWRACRGDPNSYLSPASAPGGDLAIYTASGTLLVGDVVYFSADNTVAKAAVTANYVAFAGVVVGGESMQDYVAQDSELTSATQLTAALNGKRVIVQISGHARVIGGVTCAAGVAVTGSAITAGRVTTALATAGQIIGTMVVGNAVGTNGIMLIRHR